MRCPQNRGTRHAWATNTTTASATAITIIETAIQTHVPVSHPYITTLHLKVIVLPDPFPMEGLSALSLRDR